MTRKVPTSKYALGETGTRDILEEYDIIDENQANIMVLTLLEPQSRVWGQTSQISGSLSPKRDCGPKLKLLILPTILFLSMVRNQGSKSSSLWCESLGSRGECIIRTAAH